MTTDLDTLVDSLLAPSQEEAPNPVEDQIEDAEIVDDDPDDASDVDLSDEDDVETSSDEYDEEIADDDANEDAVEPQTFSVKIDGKEEQWTLEQLKQSASGQGAINNRFREIAETNRKLEAQEAQLKSREQTLAQYEQNVIQALEALQTGSSLVPPKPPSEELVDKDPIGYLQADAKYKRELAAYQENLQRMQAVQSQNDARQKQQREQFLEDQARILAAAIPEFADQKTRGEITNKLIEFGTARYNYSKEELNSVADARQIQVLNDARKWHEYQARREAANGKAKQPQDKPVIRVGAKKPVNSASEARKKAQDRLRRTGSLQDAVSLIFKE